MGLARTRKTAGESAVFLFSSGAGDRTRTGDVQLGKLAFYQLNYARVLDSTGNVAL